MNILITGAAGGIGQAVAVEFLRDARRRGEAEPGLVLADLDGDAVRQCAAMLGGARVFPEVADLGNLDGPRRLIDRAVEQLGGLDVIISNAGMIGRGTLAELEVADFDRVFAVNTRATWMLGKAALPHLRRRGGAIVATASIAAHAPTPGIGVYGPSKAALVALVRQMALEWGEYGIRCNSVLPGPTVTGMTSGAYADPETRRVREAAIPLGRLGDPSDIAAAIVFLARPEAAFITGVDLPVDGGILTSLMKSTGYRPA